MTMKDIQYIERQQHGSIDFPFAFYDVREHHPRYHMPLHWHREFELLHVVSGSFQLSIDEIRHTLSPGDTVLITGGSLHGGTPENCHYQCVVFDLDFFIRNRCFCAEELQAILLQKNRLAYFLSSSDFFIRNSCKALMRAGIEQKQGYQMLSIGLLSSLLGYLIQKDYFRDSSVPALKNRKKIRQFKTVLSYIADHYPEKVTLEQLADCISMNKNYFCRFFQELTGYTPVGYLNYYRIESACEQLISSDKSITEIALDCGFNDAGYFIKTFHRYKHMTPSAYIRSVTGKGP